VNRQPGTTAYVGGIYAMSIDFN